MFISVVGRFLRFTDIHGTAFAFVIDTRSLFKERGKTLRQNPRGNRAMSVFNGQKLCTRISISILQYFLHLVKDITAVAWKKRHFPWELEKTDKLKVQRNWVMAGKMPSPVSFYSTLKCFSFYELQNLFSIFVKNSVQSFAVCYSELEMFWKWISCTEIRKRLF